MFPQKRTSLGRWAALGGALALLLVCLVLLGSQTATAEASPPAIATQQQDPAFHAGPGFSGPGQIVPGFAVDILYDAVWGVVEPGEAVTVNRTGDGAYGAAEANGVGFFWTPLWQPNGQPAGVAGGDTIEVYVDGALEATIPVFEVSGGIDVLADEVAGAVPNGIPGTAVTVTIGLEGAPPPANAPQATATTGGAGGFTAAFPGVDLGASNLAAVEYASGGGRVRAYLYPNDRVFEVWNQRSVQGYADPGQTVDVTVYEGAGPTVRWSGSGAAGEPHGFYSIWLAGPGDADAAQVGDLVEVDLGGGEVLATTIACLGIADVNAALDQIEGTAPAGETVVVRLWQEGGYAQTTATADGGGAFTADLGGIADLRPRDIFRVALADAEGDESLLWSGAPHLDALLDPTSEWDCVVWRVDGPFLPITLTIQTSTGVYTRENPIGPSDAGNTGGPICYLVWGPGWGPIDFAPGSTVTVRSPTWEGSLVIPDVTWSVDTAGDQVSGEAPPGEVVVTVRDWLAERYPTGGSDTQSATTASPYTVAFPDFDVRDGGTVDVHHYQPGTDYGTGLNGMAYQYFQALIGDVVEGTPPHADEVVTATLYAADGTELASTSEDDDDDPWRFRFYFGDEYRIEPGRWMTVTSQSGWTAGLQVPDLTVEADEEEDLIWGEGPKAWIVVNHGWDHGAGWQWADYLLPVDGYVLDVAHFGADVKKGDDVNVTYPARNGNRVRTYHLWPRMGANHGEDRVSGNYPVGHTFWITVTDGGGLVKATAVAATTFGGAGHTGGFSHGFETGWDDWFPLQPDLLPQDRVDYRADDGYTNSVRLGAIEGELDVDADTVSGTITAPWLAGETLEGAAFRMGFPGLYAPFTVTLDALGVGDFWGDFSPTDLLPGMDVDVRYDEPDLDYVANVFPEPEPEGHIDVKAFYSHRYVEGHSTPGANVTVKVYDSEGNWKDEGNAPVTGDGLYRLSLTADIVPGDWLAATSSDGKATSMQVIQIEGDLDVDADTVAGTMYGPGADFPARGMVRVHTPDDEWYDWDLDIDAEGDYSLDMSDKHDVVEGDEVQVFYGPWTWNQTERSFFAEARRVYLPVVVKNYAP